MKLTEEQIKFIDNYLKNSGVEYIDIRYEMTDHVATAMEDKAGDFYEEFKSYMSLHKKELLNSNYKFSRVARNKAIRLLFANVFSIKGFFIIGCLIGLSVLGVNYMGIEKVTHVFYLINNILMIVIGGFYFYYNLIKKEKLWSVADKLIGTVSIIMYLMVIVFKVPQHIDNNFYLLLYYSFIVSFIIMAIITSRQLQKKYRLRYDN